MVHPPETTPRALSRRRFLGFLGLSAWGALALPYASAALVVPPRPRRLAFHNLHTGERLDCVYWESGRYVDSALSAIDHHLRDHRTGDVVAIDRRLLDQLFALRQRLGSGETFQVISGYRSPATNAELREQGRGVARRSFHTRGMAVDLAVPGHDVAEVHRAALSLRAGGVGYYPSSGFVHVDVGPVRRW